MKNKSILLFGCLALSLASFGFTLIQWLNAPEIGYVNLTRLYDEFALKQELESKLTVVQDARKRSLDSLELTLTILSNTITNGSGDDETKRNFEAKRAEYLTKDRMFSEDNSSMAEQYDQQIWEQLNQYVTEYGNAHGLTMVVGGDGSGAVMFAKDGLDLTEDVLAFSNSRYQGKN